MESNLYGSRSEDLKKVGGEVARNLICSISSIMFLFQGQSMDGPVAQRVRTLF